MPEHKNIRCKNCLVVDGYIKGEAFCRYCGTRLEDVWQEEKRCPRCGAKLHLCANGLKWCLNCPEVFEE